MPTAPPGSASTAVASPSQTVPYTKTPNALFDLMPHTTAAEFKTLMYIQRRTGGFHKVTDAISFSQFVSGICRCDGEVLDEGTGLCRQSVISAVHGLEQRSVIFVERSRTQYGDWAVNRYTINPDVFENPSRYQRKVNEQPGLCPPGSPEGTPPSQHDEPVEMSELTAELCKPVNIEAPPCQPPESAEERALLEQMLNLGVAPRIAESLLQTHGPLEIVAQLSALPFRKAMNPAALFVKAVREGWPPPATWARAEQRLQGETEQRDRVEAQARLTAETREQEFKLSTYIALLSPSQLLSLEQEAIQCIHQEAPLWVKRPIPDVMLQAYKRQVAQAWQEAGITSEDLDLPSP